MSQSGHFMSCRRSMFNCLFMPFSFHISLFKIWVFCQCVKFLFLCYHWQAMDIPLSCSRSMWKNFLLWHHLVIFGLRLRAMCLNCPFRLYFMILPLQSAVILWGKCVRIASLYFLLWHILQFLLSCHSSMCNNCCFCNISVAVPEKCVVDQI